MLTVLLKRNTKKVPKSFTSERPFFTHWRNVVYLNKELNRDFYETDTSLSKGFQDQLNQRILKTFKTPYKDADRTFIQDLMQDSLEFLATRRGLRCQAMYEEATCYQAVLDLVKDIYECLNSYSFELNNVVGFSELRTVGTEPVLTKEVVRYNSLREPLATQSIFNARLSTGRLSLVIRGKQNAIDIFLIPASRVIGLVKAETVYKPIIQLEAKIAYDLLVWEIDGEPFCSENLEILCRKIFSLLIEQTKEELGKDSAMQNSFCPSTALSAKSEPYQEQFDAVLKGTKLGEYLQQIILEKQNLAQKIVSQQEEVQKRIARDLHDTVIADLMTLKRTLGNNKRLSRAKLATMLDQVSQQLREICQDLSPRNLSDWGLKAVVQGLLEQLVQRNRMSYIFNCDTTMPYLDAPVQLHVYRIIQEALNNIEKHAHASQIRIAIDVQEKFLTFVVTDNGKGFDTNKVNSRIKQEGGLGMESMREHAELICCFQPARLMIDSELGQGSTVKLELKLADELSSKYDT